MPSPRMIASAVGVVALTSCVLPEYENRSRHSDAGGSGVGSGGTPSTSPTGGRSAGGRGGQSNVEVTTTTGGTHSSTATATGGTHSSTATTTGGTSSSSTTATTEIQCGVGYAECEPTLPPCETQVVSDVENCGACGNRCTGKHASWACRGYNCMVAACEAGWGDCDDIDSNGCEQDISGNDAKHCGACRNACPYNACGTSGAANETAYCYPVVTIGADAYVGEPQGIAKNSLQGFRRGIGSGTQQLVAMGIVEMSAGTHYYLGLYEADPQGFPIELAWKSPLQLSLGTESTPRTNEIVLDSSLTLSADTYYWLMVLPIDGQLVTSAGPDGSLGFFPYHRYDDSFEELPSTLVELSYVPLARRTPAVYLRVASP